MPQFAGGSPPFKFTPEGELQTNNTENLITQSIQFGSAQTNTVVLPAIAGKHYEIHGGMMNTNSNTDVDIKSGATQIFYLNAPAVASSNSIAGGNMHLDTPTNTDITITCGAGTFVSVTYHIV